MNPGTTRARSAVTALVVGISVLLVLLALGVRAQALLLLGSIVLAPGLWWRWKTREFRRGVRALRRGDEGSIEHFQRFLESAEADSGFLRYQPFFNLGRPYDYVAASHNNLGALALREADRRKASAAFDAALASSNSFAPAYYGKATVQLLDGQVEDAAQTAEKGLQYEPGHRPSTILLALCQAELGDRAGAQATLSRLRKPLRLDEAARLWTKMYRYWGASDRAAKWETG